MSEFFSQIDWEAMLVAIQETFIMTIISLAIAVILGFILGIILYITKEDGLYPQKIVHRILDFIVNLFRAIPFIILIFLLLEVTLMTMGTMLGVKGALPALIVSSAPFYARMCMIALSEIDKGTIEAVMGISLVGYTAMAGCIGAGGLGNLAYMYGYVRQNMPVMYTATFFVLVIVFMIQIIGDLIVKKIDKR